MSLRKVKTRGDKQNQHKKNSTFFMGIEKMNIENKSTLHLKFSHVLQQKLIERFGKIPSANHLANQYNLRAHGTAPITQEAARRWIKGLSIPQVDRFQILSLWLGIRPEEFLTNSLEKKRSNPDSVISHDETRLISMFRNLNLSEQNALQVAAKTMVEAKKQLR